jgi:menaquinone-dependent protoporphyrinogen IX oxidase
MAEPTPLAASASASGSGSLRAPARHVLVAYATKRGSTREVADAIAARPVAVFAMGPQKMDEKSVRSARQQLDRALKRAPDLDPLDVAIFGGVIDPAKLRFPFNRMQPGDARDWDAIRAWATELAARLDDGSVD